MATRSTKQLLPTGCRLRIRDADGRPIGEVTVVGVHDGLVWIAGSPATLRKGDRVWMERRLAGDALYVAPASFERPADEGAALRRTGEWEREQRRTEVRLPIYGVVAAVRSSDGKEPESFEVELVDLSAGGAGVKGRLPFVVGDEVNCRFPLDEGLDIDMDAKVVRAVGRRPDRSRLFGLEFFEAGPEASRRIREWIFREGVRRRHR